MTSSGRGSGFTLLEVLVGAALTLLLFAMIFEFLVPAMHAYTRGTTRVDLQQKAMLGVSRITSDLQSSTPVGVNAVVEPTVLGFDRILSVTDNGVQVWERSLVVYAFDPSARALRRIVCPPPSPFTTSLSFSFNGSTPYRPSVDDLRNVASEDNGAATVVCVDVDLFTVAGVDESGDEVDIGAGITDPLAITLRLSRKEAHQQEPEVFTLKRLISLKQRL